MHTDFITPTTGTAPRCLDICPNCRQMIFDNQRVCLQNGQVRCMDCLPPARKTYYADSVAVHGLFWACCLGAFFGLCALFAVCFR